MIFPKPKLFHESTFYMISAEVVIENVHELIHVPLISRVNIVFVYMNENQ